MKVKGYKRNVPRRQWSKRKLGLEVRKYCGLITKGSNSRLWGGQESNKLGERVRERQRQRSRENRDTWSKYQVRCHQEIRSWKLSSKEKVGSSESKQK